MKILNIQNPKNNKYKIIQLLASNYAVFISVYQSYMLVAIFDSFFILLQISAWFGVFLQFFWLGCTFCDKFCDWFAIFWKKRITRSKKRAKMKNESQFLTKNDKTIQNLERKTNLKLDNIFVNSNNSSFWSVNAFLNWTNSSLW